MSAPEKCGQLEASPEQHRKLPSSSVFSSTVMLKISSRRSSNQQDVRRSFFTVAIQKFPGMWSTEHPLCARPFLGTEETQGMRPKGCRWPCDGHAGSKQRHFGNRRNSECKGRGGWLLWKTGALAALRKYAER
nr:uncharacterized protein LOC129525813 isoform X1 [Gorilla gorilla gorilla]